MRVSIDLGSGERIHAELHSRKSRELIVICHGYKSNGRTPTIRAVVKGLNKRGCSTLTFDFPFAAAVDIERQVQDIGAITRQLADRYDSFVLLAASFGALSATIAAIKLPKISGLITINGFFAMGRLGKRHRRTFRGFRALSLVLPRYKRIWKYYKRELRPGSLRVPVLVIHSGADIVVPITQSRRFFAGVESPKTFEELKTADHNLSARKDISQVVDYIGTWLAAR